MSVLLNRDAVIDRIKVMQAYIDGEAIEVDSFGEWVDSTQPNWGNLCNYRIKPTPVERWVVKDLCTDKVLIAIFETELRASSYAVRHYHSAKVIKLVEETC